MSTLNTEWVAASSRAMPRQLPLEPNSPCSTTSGGPLPTASQIRLSATLPPRLLLLLRRQIGAIAFEDLGRHADRFAERRMRVDGLADVSRLAAHLDREADLADQVAGVGADDAAADDAVGGFVEQQLGEALVAAVGDRSTRRRPGEHR